MLDDAGADPLPPRHKKPVKRAPPKRQEVPQAEPLLAKRLVELDHYRDDVWAGRYDKLSADEIRDQFRAEMLPIFVPLARGETLRQYEERFVDWLRRERHPTLHEMERDKNHAQERRLRILFANCNVDRTERFQLNRDQRTPRDRESPGQDYHRKREHSSRDRSASSERNRGKRRSQERETVTKRPRQEERSCDGSCSGTCRAKLPSADATIAEAVAAYVACACRSCLMNAVSRMATRVSELDEQIKDGCSSDAVGGPIADITRDDDRQSPSDATAQGDPSAAAITRLVLSQSLNDEPSLHLQPAAIKTSQPVKLDTEDPVEQQLAAAYDELSKRIAVNEKTLSVSSVRLAETPISDMNKLAELHDEKDALVGTIERDTQKRTEALAALAVYVWRHNRAELQRMASDTAASNVPYVQTATHRKCALLARDLTTARACATKLRRRLDARMAQREETSETVRLEELQRLGEELASTESKMRELLAQRRRELATLVHFDEQVRHQIQQTILR